MRRQRRFLRVCTTAMMWALTPLALATSARADFVVNMSSTYNGTDPVGAAPFLRATFQDTATPGTVRLTLENLMTASGGQQFVDSWLFNVAPTITSGLSFQYVSGVGAAAPTPQFSPDAYGNNQGPGVSGLPKSGLFDIVFSFQTSNSPNVTPPRFDGDSPTNVSVWNIMGPTSLTSQSFNYLSTKNNSNDNEFLSVAHIQGIPLRGGGTSSGGVSGTGMVPVVPEPSAGVLSGLGMVIAGAAGVRWRHRLQGTS